MEIHKYKRTHNGVMIKLKGKEEWEKDDLPVVTKEGEHFITFNNEELNLKDLFLKFHLDPYAATMIVEGVLNANEQEYIASAQMMIDTGMAWKFQGYFGRTCERLIRDGYCTAPSEVNKNEKQ